MHLHEYQAKQLFSDYGVPVPDGRMAESVQDAVAAAKTLGGDRWMVKAQVHAGGRREPTEATNAQSIPGAAAKPGGCSWLTA